MAVPVEEDEKYAAIDVLITYKNRVYLMHRGMDEDPLYRKEGPGNVLLYASLNEAINNGVKVFDMLRGTEEFKLRVATKINQNKKIIFSSDYKMARLLPGLVKKYLRIVRQLRMEELHIIILFDGKSYFKGMSDYLQFLHRRIKHRFYVKWGRFQ